MYFQKVIINHVNIHDAQNIFIQCHKLQIIVDNETTDVFKLIVNIFDNQVSSCLGYEDYS